MWYIGKEFDVKKNKTYKTLEGGIKAAKKQNLNLYDKEGQSVYQGVPEQPQEKQKEEGTDISTLETENGQEGVENDAAGVSEDDAPAVEMTDDVMEGALDTMPDGSVKTYDEDGNQAGEASAEKVAAAIEKQWDEFDGVQALRIRGRIRRVFAGNLRIRNCPSWQPSAVRGISAFEEKEVTHLLEVDGKQMYRTVEGYFITGDEKLVEYVGNDIN